MAFLEYCGILGDVFQAGKGHGLKINPAGKCVRISNTRNSVHKHNTEQHREKPPVLFCTKVEPRLLTPVVYMPGHFTS